MRRSIDNQRVRPNGHYRHDPAQGSSILDLNKLNFISETDLEFLSLNYRKERANKLSESRRRMILIMFRKQLSYFPSLREIRDELI